jgi:DNA-binding transcriptional LysR family regulator
MGTSQADPPPDLRALQVFLAVVAHKSMTAAANSLGLTQSAVSQAVARLEADFHVSLIDRQSRPLRPTQAGQALAARAQGVLADVDAMAREFRDTAAQGRPRVRLGLIDSVAATIGAPLIRAIRSEVSEVSVWSGISPTLRTDLTAGRLDLVVTSDPSLMAGAKMRLLMREPFIAVVPKSLGRLPDSIDPIRMSERLPLVRYSERSVIGADIEADLRRRGRVPPRVFEFDGTDGVFSMVAAGLGWAVTTPLCLVHGHMIGRGVRALALSGPPFSRDIFLFAANALGAGLADRVRTAAVDLIGELVDTDVRRMAPDAVGHIRLG